MTINQYVKIAQQSINEGDCGGRLDFLHAVILVAEDACWPWRLCIVIGYAGHVSDVFRIPKGIDVCHRGSLGLGRDPEAVNR